MRDGDNRPLYPQDLWSLELELWPQVTWGLLAQAASGFDYPFRCPAVATSGGDGPQLRTVILRAASAATRRLLFYTDARSPKVRELRQLTEMAWMFYDPGKRLQLRAWGAVSLHQDDELTEACWETCSAENRRNYGGRAIPGTALDAATPITHPAPLEDQGGRGNFLVVACRVARMDALLLGPESHRRLDMRWHEPSWVSTWLNP
ncbi:MAG: pyridoxamine 5'-phosphate oxidase family protein [Gammaproteobacteria bacterium]|nr:pyridoxamine 5'-phosphate oxidase family protein [Gammaproteobacteria bacterium]